MKISFQKEESGEVKVLIKDGDAYQDFSYSDMIKQLFKDKKIEESEIIGDFSEGEVASITDITNEIGDALAKVCEDTCETDESKQI